MKTQEERLIVAFHIGRGGRYNNPNHLTYLGEKNFQDLINLNSEHLFRRGRDEKGKFCKPYLTDSNNNFVTDDGLDSEVGKLEFDTIYDTDYCKYIEDCTEHELDVIVNDSWQYKSHELKSYLDNLLIIKD